MKTSRRSVADTATVEGTTLHSGEQTRLQIKPGTPGEGIVFRRVDLPDGPEVKAVLHAVKEVERRIVIEEGDTTFFTIEHLLAATNALQIDDLLVELDGPELPNGDGSPQVYLDALREANPTECEGDLRIISVRSPFTVTEGDAHYVVAPHDGLRLTANIAWEATPIGRQSGCFEITPDEFAESLSKARTFGFVSELEGLREKGLAKGASENTVIAVSESGVVGTELRWPDEFVRHKIVDMVGDLALLGARVEADIVAFKPSHKGNVALARALELQASPSSPPVMGIQEILDVMPHRYPLLLVDRIVAMEPGKRIVGIKNVTINEPFFQGHFPEHPVMPGVLVIEAMAQVGGMMLMGAFEKPQEKVVYFMGIDKVKFRKPVVPGDQIRFELEMLHFRGRNCRMSGVGYVDGKPVAEAEMMARVMDK